MKMNSQSRWSTFAGLTVAAIALGLFLTGAASAQTQEPSKPATEFGYSFLDIDNSNGQAANAFHRGHYGLVNLLFYPVENAMVGGEFQWGRRENFLDGFKSDDFRIQFSLKYNFNKTFTF